MRIGVISDLHLGGQDLSRSTFGPAELFRFLVPIFDETDLVIVNGDLFDLSRAPLPFMSSTYRDHIRARYSDAFQLLDSARWVYGNHDRWLGQSGIPESIAIEAQGRRIFFQHGHQFDPWLKKIRWLETSANFVAGWMERARLTPVSTWMGEIPEALSGNGATEDRALEMKGFDMMVYGHSHQLSLSESDRGVVIRSGCVTEGRADWVLIDTDKDEVCAYSREGLSLRLKLNR